MPGSTSTPDDPNVVVVWLDAEPLDDPIVGLWCDECALPSRVEQTFCLTIDGRPSSTFVVSACTDHG